MMKGSGLKVCVIGAGPGGLAAARVLSQSGYDPLVLEKDQVSGGVWNHVAGDDSRPMYRGLRTNLPREIMAFRERPWGGAGKSYVTHQQVAEYLHSYEHDFGLEKYIHYESEVRRFQVTDQPSAVLFSNNEVIPKIEVEWEKGGHIERGCFDAVCVANGHYAKPTVPHINGMKDHFHGDTLHSMAYDDPQVFSDRVVLCVGGRASGADLAREISHHAKHVYLSDTTLKKRETQGSVTVLPRLKEVSSDDGSIIFEHGHSVSGIDTIIFCTGYDYSFPFINDESNLQLTTEDRRVTPLYEQLWHAQYPNICFLGLPHSVLPFPMFELQAQAFVAQLERDDGAKSCALHLPSRKEREEAALKDAASGGAKPNGRVRDTHYLGGDAQWEYWRELARYAGVLDADTEGFIETNKAIMDHSSMERKGGFLGGEDVYRETCYERVDSKQGFRVTSSQLPQSIPIETK